MMLRFTHLLSRARSYFVGGMASYLGTTVVLVQSEAIEVWGHFNIKAGLVQAIFIWGYLAEYQQYLNKIKDFRCKLYLHNTLS